MWLATVIVAITIVVAIALAVWFFTERGPARGVGGVDERADSQSDRFYGGADRPAGPDAEAMAEDRQTRFE